MSLVLALKMHMSVDGLEIMDKLAAPSEATAELHRTLLFEVCPGLAYDGVPHGLCPPQAQILFILRKRERCEQMIYVQSVCLFIIRCALRCSGERVFDITFLPLISKRMQS